MGEAKRRKLAGGHPEKASGRTPSVDEMAAWLVSKMPNAMACRGEGEYGSLTGCVRMLMPENTPVLPDFDPEMHLNISDWHSLEAAGITLHEFGIGVSYYSLVQDGPMLSLFCQFDAGKAGKALAFYNKLPADMRGWAERHINGVRRIDPKP